MKKSSPYSRFSPTTANPIRWSCVAIALSLPFMASAQETFATLIENKSSATIETPPNTIVIQLSRSYEADTLAQAAREALKLAPTMRDALKAAGYERAALKMTGPMIPFASAKSIRVDAEIRIGLSSTGEEGARGTAFATAVDKLTKIADDLHCAIENPTLDVADRAEFENKAVQRAIENAFARAQAAATIMRLEIVSVDRVTIDSITWHVRPEELNQEASADRIGVTAEISVAYLATPAGN